VVILLYAPRHPWIIPGAFLLPFALRARHRTLLVPLTVGTLIWLFPLMGFVFPHRLTRPSGPTLRVLSYNTTHAADGVEGLRSIALETRADLVLLQWSSHLADEALSGKGFEGWTVRRADQFTVASRYPVSSVETLGLPFDLGPPCAHAVLQTPLGIVDVYNIRPHSAREEVAFRHNRNLWQRARDLLSDLRHDRMREFTAFRGRQLRSVVAEFVTGEHFVIVAGDTNLPNGSLFLHRHLGALKDAFVDSGWGFGHTYPAKLPWLRLDRILLGSGLEARSFQVLPRHLAAHRPVLAEISREPGADSRSP
jgi:vancomycin resistance protein VanJ